MADNRLFYNNKWFSIYDGYLGGKFLGTVALDDKGLNVLYDTIVDPNIFEAFFKDIEHWLMSIIYVPTNWLPRIYEGLNLKIGNTVIEQPENEPNYSVGDLNNNTASLFYMGGIDNRYYNLTEEYKEEIDYNYLWMEPYTKCRAYLPYLGFVEIPMKYVLNYAIGFWLQIDYSTGQGMYYICAYDDLPKSSYGEYWREFPPIYTTYNNADPKFVISNHICQVGTQIPVSTVNAADRLRNITLSVVRDVINSARSGTGTLDVRNSFGYIVNNINLHPNVDTNLNPNIFNYSSKSIRIIIERVETELPPKELIGYPFECEANIKDVYGLTTVDDISMENFSGTENEKNELKTLMTSPIILNDYYSQEFYIFDGTFNYYYYPSNTTFEELINKIPNITIVNGIVYYKNSMLKRNEIPVRSTDYIHKGQYYINDYIEDPVITKFRITFNDTSKIYNVAHSKSINLTFEDFIRYELSIGDTNYEIINGIVYYKNAPIIYNNNPVYGTDIILENNQYYVDEYYSSINIYNNYTNSYISIPPINEGITWEEYINLNPGVLTKYEYQGISYIYATNFKFLNTTPITNNKNYCCIYRIINGEKIPVKSTDSIISTEGIYYIGYDSDYSIKLNVGRYQINGNVYISGNIINWSDFISSYKYTTYSWVGETELGKICIYQDNLTAQDEIVIAEIDIQDRVLAYQPIYYDTITQSDEIKLTDTIVKNGTYVSQ